jgi:L-methionine (R)-S-oxide reductase
MPGSTDDGNNFIINLISVAEFLEQQDTLDTSLHDLAGMVAKALDSTNCSIMLLKEEHEDGEINLRVKAHSGNLPREAYNNDAPVDQSIASTVANTGEALLVPDIEKSVFADLASRSSQTSGGFLSIPLIIAKHVAGVININSPIDGRIYNQHDLELATILSMFIAKSIYTIRLQNLLKSRFAIATLAKDESMKRSSPESFTQEPEKVAKILAKGFYTDMKHAGMGPDHILKAATEIIGLLQTTLERHKKWEARSKS